jgi:hypothetical protein
MQASSAAFGSLGGDAQRCCSSGMRNAEGLLDGIMAATCHTRRPMSSTAHQARSIKSEATNLMHFRTKRHLNVFFSESAPPHTSPPFNLSAMLQSQRNPEDRPKVSNNGGQALWALPGEVAQEVTYSHSVATRSALDAVMVIAPWV